MLTKERAFDYTIQQWEWLAQNGSAHPENWPGWAGVKAMATYTEEVTGSPLCWYAFQEFILTTAEYACEPCPLKCAGLDQATNYEQWEQAKTPATRRKYARLYAEELKAARASLAVV